MPTGPPDAEPEDDPEEEPMPPGDGPEEDPEEEPPDDVLPDFPEDDPEDDDPEEEDPDEEPDPLPLVPPPSSPSENSPGELLPQAEMAGATASATPQAIHAYRPGAFTDRSVLTHHFRVHKACPMGMTRIRRGLLQLFERTKAARAVATENDLRPAIRGGSRPRGSWTSVTLVFRIAVSGTLRSPVGPSASK
jgi:hypothetical protein